MMSRSALQTQAEHQALRIAVLQEDTQRCWSNHMGMWAIEPMWISQALMAIQSGLWSTPSRAALYMDGFNKLYSVEIEAARREERQYDLHENVAILPLHGPMMKAESKFGGTSTVRMRQMIRQAAKDKDVDTILLHIDSPGGHVSGTHELANEVSRARESKRVVAHVDDLCASAAYWVASQCESITVNETGEVGSIGTIAILTDSSKSMDRSGVKVHVVSTGQFKGVGVPGAEVSEEALAYIRERVESLNEHFQASVMRGRNRNKKQMESISDGRMFIGAQAKSLGMVDNIMDFDAAIEMAIGTSQKKTSGKRAMQARQLSAFRHKQGV